MYGRSFDREKRKTPRNTQTPHKLKRETGVERGETPSRFFYFTIRQSPVTTHRRSQRQRALRSRRAGAAPTRLTPAPIQPARRYAFGPENAPAVRLPGPSHCASMGQGTATPVFNALDPMRKRSGRPGRRKHWSKGWVEKKNDGHGPREEFPRMGVNILASLSRDTRTSPKKGNGPEEPPLSQSKAVNRSHKGEGKILSPNPWFNYTKRIE